MDENVASRSKRQVPVRDAELLLRQLKTALKVPPPPLITHKELPAPPGCRSLVTQKCHKVPEKFNRRVPEEVCREVPGVECHLELEEVEEPKCYNVPVEECDDILKEIPYLVEEEECEDVEKLECTLVSMSQSQFYFTDTALNLVLVKHCKFHSTKNIVA